MSKHHKHSKQLEAPPGPGQDLPWDQLGAPLADWDNLTTWNFPEINWEEINKELNTIDWDSLFNSEEINKAFKEMEEAVFNFDMETWFNREDWERSLDWDNIEAKFKDL